MVEQKAHVSKQKPRKMSLFAKLTVATGSPHNPYKTDFMIGITCQKQAVRPPLSVEHRRFCLDFNYDRKRVQRI